MAQKMGVSMRTNATFLLSFFALTLASAAHASRTVLPDACGDDKVHYDVEAKKDQPAPAAPADGKAQIVFIETLNRPSFWTGAHVSDITTRFGMDGAWVGAARSNTYFTLDIAPGTHKLCTSVKGNKDMIAMTSFTAEAGKTYYYEFKIEPTVSHGQVMVSGGATGASTSVTLNSSFKSLDEDEGKFRIKASALAVGTTQ